MEILSVTDEVQLNDSITHFEYRSHLPFSSNTYNVNDEIRILIQHQDSVTLPSESYLYITGNLTKDGSEPDANLKLVNNGAAFLFEQLRYELSGVTIDKLKNVGISSTLRGLLMHKPWDKSLENAGWNGVGVPGNDTSFTYCIPLKFLLPLFEHYNKVILNQKQELILLLSSSQHNCIIKSDAVDNTAPYKLEIHEVQWRVPHLRVHAFDQLNLMKIVETNQAIQVAFRSWDLHEYPTLPQTTKISWALRTTTALETPRFVVLAFQTNRKNQIKQDASLFDSCDLTEFKVYLNDRAFPYLNIKGESSTIYDLYARFQGSYNQDGKSYPLMNRSDFKKSTIYVIDCSHQELSVKNGTVDLKVDLESSKNFPKDTSAYCLVINDVITTYQALTGIVNRQQ